MLRGQGYTWFYIAQHTHGTPLSPTHRVQPPCPPADKAAGRSTCLSAFGRSRTRIPPTGIVENHTALNARRGAQRQRGAMAGELQGKQKSILLCAILTEYLLQHAGTHMAARRCGHSGPSIPAARPPPPTAANKNKRATNHPACSATHLPPYVRQEQT